MFLRFIQALNEIHENLLALVLIGFGVLMCKCDKVTGQLLITIGATVWQKRSGEKLEKAEKVERVDKKEEAK